MTGSTGAAAAASRQCLLFFLGGRLSSSVDMELLMEIAPAPAAAIPIPTTAAAVGMGDFDGEEPLGCGADTRSGNWINRTKNANNLFWT